MNNANSLDAGASAAITLKILQVQIRLLYRHTWSGLAVVVIIALTAGVILWPVLPHWKLQLWVGGVALLSLVRAVLLVAFTRRAPPASELPRWAYWHVAGVAASGVLWAMPSLFLWPLGAPAYQLVWPVCILPLCSLAVSAYCTWTPSWLSFLLLAALPVSLRLLAEGLVVFALLGLFFTVVLAHAGRIMHQTSVQAQTLGLRNQALSRFLSAEKAAVENLNARLQLEVSERAQAQQQLARQNQQLERALSNVKQLSGLLPICGSCKKIRNDKGYWEQLEAFILQRSEAQFSHGICPECAQRQFPEIFR